MMMPGAGMMGWGGLGMGLGPVVMLLFWVLVAVAVVVAVGWLWDRGPGVRRSAGDDPALEILRDRYARGEIDREEFEARRQDLAASRRGP